jgi:SAM-dependent methyltransferase
MKRSTSKASFDLFAAPAIEITVQHFRDFGKGYGLLLDVGCGDAYTTSKLRSPTVRITGIDANETAIRVARTRLPSGDFLVAEAESLPFPDRTFDHVLAFSVLQYTMRSRVLSECARVLKSDGTAAFVENLASSPLARIYRVIHRAMRWSYPPYQHPISHLKWEDLSLYREFFDHVRYTPIHLFTPVLLAVPVIKGRLFGTKLQSPRPEYYRVLSKFDEHCLRWLPSLGRWCWMMVILAACPSKSN